MAFPTETHVSSTWSAQYRAVPMADAVRSIMKDTRYREMRCVERRCDTRMPFRRYVRVTPLEENQQPADADESLTFIASTREISTGGISVLHDRPIDSQRVLLRFELLGGIEITIVANLSWCRYLGDFWYLSGGRLTSAAIACATNSLDDFHPDELLE